MLAESRRSMILDTVNRERIVKVSDLAEALGVSLMTVRRDIDTLEDAGELKKYTAEPKQQTSRVLMNRALS